MGRAPLPVSHHPTLRLGRGAVTVIPGLGIAISDGWMGRAPSPVPHTPLSLRERAPHPIRLLAAWRIRCALARSGRPVRAALTRDSEEANRLPTLAPLGSRKPYSSVGAMVTHAQSGERHGRRRLSGIRIRCSITGHELGVSVYRDVQIWLQVTAIMLPKLKLDSNPPDFAMIPGRPAPIRGRGSAASDLETGRHEGSAG